MNITNCLYVCIIMTLVYRQRWRDKTLSIKGINTTKQNYASDQGNFVETRTLK